MEAAAVVEVTVSLPRVSLPKVMASPNIARLLDLLHKAKASLRTVHHPAPLRHMLASLDTRLRAINNLRSLNGPLSLSTNPRVVRTASLSSSKDIHLAMVDSNVTSDVMP
jgi:hypothetical protein